MGKQYLFVTLTLFLGGVCVLMGSTEVSAMSAQKERPVIALRCPPEAPEPQALCRAMFQALAQAAPGAAIRTLAPSESFSPRAGDLDVSLRLDDVLPNRVTGHLEWRRGQDGDLQRGPDVNLEVMDTTVSPQFYAQFADGMVRATPTLLSEPE